MSQGPVSVLNHDVALATDLREASRRELIATLVSIGSTKVVGPGHVLFEKGDRSDNHGVILLRGHVRIHTRNGETAIVSGPRLLGEAKLFDLKCERNATVTTVGPVEVWEFLWSEFESSLERRAPRDTQQAIQDWLMEQAFSA